MQDADNSLEINEVREILDAEMTGNKVLVTIYKSLKYQFDQDRKWYIMNRKPSGVI